MISTTFTLSADLFEANAGSDEHIATSWDILDKGVVVWSSYDDAVNLTSIDVPLSAIVAGKAYIGRVMYRGATYGWSIRHTTPIMVSYEWNNKVVAIAQDTLVYAANSASENVRVFSERTFSLRLTPPKGMPKAFTSHGHCTVFSKDGGMLLVGHADLPYISAYVRQRDAYVRVNGVVPPGPVMGIACNDRGLIVCTMSIAPYLYLAKVVGDQLFNVPITDQLSGAGAGVAFSPNGKMLAVASATSPQLIVYKVTDYTIERIGDSGTVITAGHLPRVVEFNSTGDRVTVTTNSVTYTFRLDDNGTLTRLTTGVITRAAATDVDYNAQGTHAVASYQTGNRFEIHSVDVNGSLGAGVALTAAPVTGGGIACRFSPDSQTLVISFDTAPYVRMYKLYEGQYIPAISPTVGPNSAAYSCKYNVDGTILVVGMSSAPFVAFYRRDGDLFIRLSSPTVLPVSAVRGIDVRGDIVTVSPDLLQYRITEDFTVSHITPTIDYARTGTIQTSDSHVNDGKITTAIGTSTTVKVFEDDQNVDVLTKSSLIEPSFHPNVTSAQLHAASADGNFLAVATSSTAPYLVTYCREGQKFSPMEALTPYIPSEVTHVDLNHDGSLMVVTTNQMTVVYKRSGNQYVLDSEFGDQYNEITNLVSLSSTGEFLVVSTTKSTAVYKQVADNTRERVFFTTHFTSTQVAAVTFTADDKYMVIVGSKSPHVFGYDTSDFSELLFNGTIPTPPSYAVWSATWSPLTDRLCVTALVSDPQQSLFLFDLDRASNSLNVAPQSHLFLPTNFSRMGYKLAITNELDGRVLALRSRDANDGILFKQYDAVASEWVAASKLTKENSVNETISEVDVTEDGNYLIIRTSSSPFVAVYSQEGGSYSRISLPHTFNSSTSGAAISRTGKFIAVTFSTSPFLRVFERDNAGAYTSANIVTGSPKIAASGVTFSHDEGMLSVTCRGTEDVSILHMTQLDGGWYGIMTAPTTGNASTDSSIAVSTSGTKIICWSNETTTPRLYYYSKNNQGHFTLYHEWSETGKVAQCLFSPDERDLIVVRTAGDSLINVYQPNESNTMVPLTDVTNVPMSQVGIGYRACFFGDGEVLLVTCERYPYVVVYEQTETGYVRVHHERVVSEAGTRSATGVAIDLTGTFVALFTSNSLHLLKREVDRFVEVNTDVFNVVHSPLSATFTNNGQSLIVGMAQSPYVELFTQVNGAFERMSLPQALPTSSVLDVTVSTGDYVTLSLHNPPYIAEYTYTPTQLTNYAPVESPLTDPLDYGWPVYVTADFLVVFSYTKLEYTVYRVDNGVYYKHTSGALQSLNSNTTLLAVDCTTTAATPSVLLVTKYYAYVASFSPITGNFSTTKTIYFVFGGLSSHYLTAGGISPNGLRITLGRHYYASRYGYAVDVSNAVTTTEYVRTTEDGDFSASAILTTPDMLYWSTKTNRDFLYTYYCTATVSAIRYCTDRVLYIGTSYSSSNAAKRAQIHRHEYGTNWAVTTNNTFGDLSSTGWVTSIDAVVGEVGEIAVACVGRADGPSTLVLMKGTSATRTHNVVNSDTYGNTLETTVKFSRTGKFIAVGGKQIYNGHKIYDHDASINVTSIAHTPGDKVTFDSSGACAFAPDDANVVYSPFISQVYRPKLYELVSDHWYRIMGASGGTLRTRHLHQGQVVVALNDSNGLDVMVRSSDGTLETLPKQFTIENLEPIVHISVNTSEDRLVYSTDTQLGVYGISSAGVVATVQSRTSVGSVQQAPNGMFMHQTNDLLVVGRDDQNQNFRVCHVPYDDAMGMYGTPIEWVQSSLHSYNGRFTNAVGVTPDLQYLFSITGAGFGITPDVNLVLTKLNNQQSSVVFPLSIKRGLNVATKHSDICIASHAQYAINRLTWNGVSLTPSDRITTPIANMIPYTLAYEPSADHLVYTTIAAARGWYRVDLATGIQTAISGSPSHTSYIAFNATGNVVIAAHSSGISAYQYTNGVLTALPSTAYGIQVGRGVAYAQATDRFFVSTSNFRRPVYGVNMMGAITDDFTVLAAQSLTTPTYSRTGDYVAVGMTSTPFVNVWYKNNLLVPTGHVVNTGTVDYLVFSPDEQVLVGVMNRTSGWTGSAYTVLIQYKVTPTAVTVVDEVNFGSTQTGLGVTIDPVTDELIIQTSSEGVSFYPRKGDKYDLSNANLVSWTSGIRANNNARHAQYDNNGDLMVLYESGSRLTKYNVVETRGSYSASPLFMTNVTSITDFIGSPNGSALLTRYSTTISAYFVDGYSTSAPTGANSFSGVNHREYYKFINDEQFVFGKASSGSNRVTFFGNFDNQTNTVVSVTPTWDPVYYLATQGGISANETGLVVYGLNGSTSWAPITSMHWDGSLTTSVSEVRGDAINWTRGINTRIKSSGDKLAVIAHIANVILYDYSTNLIQTSNVLNRSFGSNSSSLLFDNNTLVIQRTSSALGNVGYDTETMDTITVPSVSTNSTTTSAISFNPSRTQVALVVNDKAFIYVYEYDAANRSFGASVATIATPTLTSVKGLEWISDDLIVLSHGNGTESPIVRSPTGSNLPIVDPMLTVRCSLNTLTKDPQTGGLFASNTTVNGPFESTIGLIDVRRMVWGLPLPVETPPSNVKSIAMSNDSNWIAVATGAGHPYVWYREANEYKLAVRDSTPSMNATSVDIQSNRLFVSSTITPFAHVFSLDYEAKTVTYGTQLSPVSGTGNWIAASDAGDTVVVAHNTSPFMSVFKEIDGAWIKMIEPDVLARSNAISCTISEDGMYVAVTYTVSPYLSLYRINSDGSISDLSGLKDIAGGAPSSVRNTGHKISFGYKPT